MVVAGGVTALLVSSTTEPEATRETHPGADGACPDRARRHPPRVRPARTPDSAHRWCARRWQVFGLAGVHLPVLLLAVASQVWRTQCSMTAVVPTHRCGAVPDSHRIPSRPLSTLRLERNHQRR
ncbi:hypothetical protein GCM10009610_58560 [Pseudonocardia xinjiangensis]